MKAFYLLLVYLPSPIAYSLAYLSYLVLFYLVRYRTDVVEDNLKHALPELTQAERKQLKKRFYRFFCDNIFEVLRSMRMTPEDIDKHVEFTNPEVLQSTIDKKQSLILLSIHQSNWEWLLLSISVKLPMPIDAVYKPLHNSTFDELIKKSRESHGASMISNKTAGKEILRKRREFRGFAMTADQAPSGKELKYWHSYLNRPAAFYVGPQKIADMMNYPVFYVKMHRVKRGYYTVEFERLSADPGTQPSQQSSNKNDEFPILSAYIKAAERSILAQPETFLWTNRRWRRKPMQRDVDLNVPEID